MEKRQESFLHAKKGPPSRVNLLQVYPHGNSAIRWEESPGRDEFSEAYRSFRSSAFSSEPSVSSLQPPVSGPQPSALSSSFQPSASNSQSSALSHQPSVISPQSSVLSLHYQPPASYFLLPASCSLLPALPAPCFIVPPFELSGPRGYLLRCSLASMHSVAWGTFISRSLGISLPVVLQIP